MFLSDLIQLLFSSSEWRGVLQLHEYSEPLKLMTKLLSSLQIMSVGLTLRLQRISPIFR